MVKTMKKISAMERDTDKALLVVRITNNQRLTADVTEDFFLVDCERFDEAIGVLDGQDLYYLSDVKFTLDEAGIPYEHVLNGHRFFLGEVTETEVDE